MRIITLALKDLTQILRDRKSLAFLMLMPMIFTFFFGFMFQGQSGEQDTRLPVAVVNQDPDGLLSAAFVRMLEGSTTLRMELVDSGGAEKLDSRIMKGELAAAVIVPPGFSAAALDGQPAEMEMVIDEETQDGQTARRGFQTILTRLMGAFEAARISAQAYADTAGFASPADRTAFLEDAFRQAAQGWENQPLSIRVTGPQVESESPFGANPFNQFSPGMIVQFAIFGLTTAAAVMVLERRQGAMRRLMSTPMTRAELIAGHLLAMFVLFFAQQLLLVVFGQLALKVNYLSAPLAILLVMAALALWVSSLGLLIASLVKGEDQVVMWAMLAMFIFSALGGCWFSLEMVGETFAAIGHLTPSAWAIDGFQNIIVRGQGLSSVLLPVGVLLAYSLAFFGIAVWKFKVE